MENKALVISFLVDEGWNVLLDFVKPTIYSCFILTILVQKPEYPGHTRSIPCLLMPWWCKQCSKLMVAQLPLVTKKLAGPVKFDLGQVKIIIDYIRREIFGTFPGDLEKFFVWNTVQGARASTTMTLSYGITHSWWRHQTEPFSTLLALCVGN